MKERLKELADHCWKDAFHYSPNGPETYTEFDYDKFAELIVRECAAYAFSDDQDHKAMLNHFGVKE